MEVDFDKEIDALLRKANRDGPVLVGDLAGSQHLDADEISALAENASPEKFRALYTAHVADCDRCRKILSNVLLLNAEAAPAAASPPSAITIAEREMPWYRRFFLFPNLAYLMGSLVLIFGGFLAFTIVRNSSVGDAVVSQVADSEAMKGGPNFQGEPSFAANTANMAANANSNVAGGMTTATNSTATDDVTLGQRGPLAEAEVRQEGQNYSLDGAGASPPAVASAQPPPPAPMAAAKDAKLADRDDFAKEKSESKVAQNAPLEQSKTDSTLNKQQQYPGAGLSQSGPMRNNENVYNRQLENLDRRREADKKAARAVASEEAGSGRKAVGGRTFERKQGVWYDTAYAGRPTINIRRGTAEFNRLDAGLRSIANSMSGTVVVVWGAKAYRIQ